jgi:type II secretory pathway pseudopilin PulG
MVELGLTLVIISLLTALSVPRIGPLLSRSRVNQTAAVVAADLETAFAIAGRQRRPVRLSCVCASVRYQVADRSDGTPRLSRTLSGNEESGVTALAFSTPQVDIFPSGVASAPLLVTISAGAYSRQIQMTSAGQVRILP